MRQGLPAPRDVADVTGALRSYNVTVPILGHPSLRGQGGRRASGDRALFTTVRQQTREEVPGSTAGPVPLLMAVALPCPDDHSLGGNTVAWPSITTTPSWFVTAQSSCSRFFSTIRSATLTVAVIRSPGLTGAQKRSVCPR